MGSAEERRALSEYSNAVEPTGPSESGAPALLVERIHRMWVVASTAAIATESGLARLSLARIAARARLRRSTVELMFTDVEDCVLETFDAAAALAIARVEPWFADGIGAAARLRIAVGAAMGFCEDEPELARVLCLGAPLLASRRARMTFALSTALAREFGPQQGRLCTEAAAAGIDRALMIVRGSFSDGLGVPYSEVGSEVLAALLTPFLGVSEARLEAARPVELIRVEWHPPTANGERPCLDMRLSADLLRELARAWELSPREDRRRTA